MDDVIRRSVERQFPELSGKYHLPRFARVVGIADAPASSSLCDDFRPRLAADLEVLGEDGEPDSDLPILAGVPLPMPIGGNEMGMFGFPEEGTSVVVCFAYGLPHKPYVQAVLPHGLSLPKIPRAHRSGSTARRRSNVSIRMAAAAPDGRTYPRRLDRPRGAEP